MRAFWKFNLLRLALLLAVLAVLWVLQVPLLMSLLLAAIASTALSYVLLRGPRAELAAVLAERHAERVAAGHRSRAEQDDAAEDAEVEDDSVDAGHPPDEAPDHHAEDADHADHADHAASVEGRPDAERS